MKLKNILLDSIDKLIIRGESIESLIDRTSDLQTSSLQFHNDAAKLNRCCIIL